MSFMCMPWGHSGHGSIEARFLNTSTGWTRMASLMLWLLYPGKGACSWGSAEVCGACIYVAFACCRCHPWTGECECKPGWDGTMCLRPCPFYTYGKGCRNNCNCKNDAQCSPVNGTCICAAGVHLGLHAEALRLFMMNLIYLKSHAFVSSQQTLRQDHSIKMVDYCLENVALFKYIGLPTNQNCIHWEMKSKLHVGLVCYHLVQKLCLHTFYLKTWMLKHTEQ